MFRNRQYPWSWFDYTVSQLYIKIVLLEVLSNMFGD